MSPIWKTPLVNVAEDATEAQDPEGTTIEPPKSTHAKSTLSKFNAPVPTEMTG